MRSSTLIMILVAAAMTLPFFRLLTVSAEDVFHPMPRVFTPR